MNNDLYIWVGQQSSAPWDWIVPDGLSGQAITDQDKAALKDLDYIDVVMIVPGQLVRHVQINLPALPKRDLPQAIAYAVEEVIALPLAEQHIVNSQIDKNRVAIIIKDKLRSLIDALEKHDLSPNSVYADYDILLSDIDMVQYNDRIIVPGPEGHAYDVTWKQSNQSNIAEVKLEQLMNFVNTSDSINLRQGEFKKPIKWGFGGDKITGLRKPLILSGMFATCLSVVFLAQLVVQGRAANLQSEGLRVKTANIYQTITGGDAPDNPTQALTQYMQKSRVDSVDVMDLIGELLQLIQSVDGVMVDNLYYDSTQSGLSLRLIFPNFEAASQLEKNATSMGTLFELGGIREQGGQLIGEADFEKGVN